MERLIIQSESKSTIMSFGVSSNSGARWLLLGGAVLLFLSLALVTLWWLLNGSFSLPEQTGLLISTSPRAAQSLLTSEERSLLPAPWQSALSGRSSWPVILGAYFDQFEWRYYALVPRWRAPDTQVRETIGLVALIADRTLPKGNRRTRYLEQMDWADGHWNAPLAFWIDPANLFPNAVTPDAKQVTGYVNHQIIMTTIPWPGASNKNLEQADVSLNLVPNASSTVYAIALLEQLGLDDLPFQTSGIKPAHISIQFQPNFEPERISLSLAEPMTEDEVRRMLGGFGLTNHTADTMPDGTMSQEQILSLGTGSNFGKRSSTRYGEIDVEPNQIVIGSASSSPSVMINPPKSCQRMKPQAYISGRMLERLFLGSTSSSSISFEGILIGSLNNALAVCFE
ncbi:MAG TPA: hypothetical protein VFQ60_03565 [Patescibacteria group bacterium]|nr:hypothetical protein [Patescibacteria group bacterium]